MQFVDSEFEIEHQSWPVEGPPLGREGAKKSLEARRLIERRLELKRLRELLDEPDFCDFE